MTLNEVLRNTNYDVALFSEEARKYIEDAIVVKTVRGKEMAHITCLKRGKEIVLKPEEAVRQLYLYKLIHEYGYPVSRIEVEFPIHFGREVKRADIAIMDKDRPMVPYIIVELKKPKLTDGKEQLKSYCNATGAPIGVWTYVNEIQFMRDFYDGVMNEVSRILRHYIDDLLPSKGYNQTVNSKIRDACLRLNSALNVKFDYNYKYPHDVGALAKDLTLK